MAPQVDYNDPNLEKAAAEILRRHNDYASEAEITSAVRDFLVQTGLVNAAEVREENPPSEGSRHAVDLTALDTFIEFKRRIGTQSGFIPNPEYVEQLDGYLDESAKAGRSARRGVLTDGKHWLLRWPGAGPVRNVRPYAFTLDDPGRWPLLYEWLRDSALFALENIPATRQEIEKRLGPVSALYQQEVTLLKSLYSAAADHPTVTVKRRLWHDLLRTALGEIARSPAQMDDLFVRHTYLSAVIGMVVQASFGIDIKELAENDPVDLLRGNRFHSVTGLQGVVESDFFAWPAETDGASLLKTLAGRVARFDWDEAPSDIAAILYETVIPPSERRQLGEYYTPAWLAGIMVEELVAEPLEQKVLDPACGSGAFVTRAVEHFIAAADKKGLHARETLNRLLVSVIGVDIHPVAVHLARTAWVLAARRVIADAEGASSITIPVYLGDALQLRLRTGDMFAEHEVTIQVEGNGNIELVFPMSLVDRPADFDSFMNNVSAAIERGDDPYFALEDSKISVSDDGERHTLKETIGKLKRLHDEGLDHIWAYYTRNMVRPVALSRQNVDVVIGNPPWINYNQTVSTLRDELRSLSQRTYGIWAGGRYATHQDVAGLFFTRSVDLYLKHGGVIGMVMPHSALQTGQYSRWRTGKWKTVRDDIVLAADFTYKTAWDLEGLEPNDFFPIPASVVFAKRVGLVDPGRPLVDEVERWSGAAGAPYENNRVKAAITDTGQGTISAYARHSRQGATIVPRCLFFVEETENPAIIQARQTITVNPRRGSQDKAPWRDLDLTALTGQTLEDRHVFDVHLGETVVPYATLAPLKAALPVRSGSRELPLDRDVPGGIKLVNLEWRMRQRWQTICELWERNKAAANRLSLSGQLDYYGKLTAQLEWQHNPGDRPVRVVYTAAGIPTAAVVSDDKVLIESKLFWIACRGIEEANYISAIINSDALYADVAPLMSKGQWGARDLQGHLWRLPIPEFDPADGLHESIAAAGEAAAKGSAEQLEKLREERDRVTVTIARRELRKLLRGSAEGQAVEDAVGSLLGGG